MVEIALPGWHWEVAMHDQRIDGDRALPVDRQEVPESYRGPDALTKDI
jgi:hypothetical protein